MPNRFTFSSESVGEGHPDKIADYISDSILDAFLEKDPYSRVACETLLKSNCVYLAGEISSKAHVDFDLTVRKAIQEIGYTKDEDTFHPEKIFISNAITKQSEEIANSILSVEQGAGDQGMMFGYACDETPEMLPSPILYAHLLTQQLAKLRKNSTHWLRPDCKAQVALEYEKKQPAHVKNIVLSTQHTLEKSYPEIKNFCIENIIKKVIPSHLLSDSTEYFINPTGSFLHGGPEVDAGLTGRKIIVDTYGGWSRHGGGAFSGKDPSKVDRSAAYMCRYVAKNIVAAGLAKEVEIEVAYAIGIAAPTSIHLSTFGSGLYPDEAILNAVKETFSFKPADILKKLNLLQPIYKATVNYGHFTKPHLPWEQISEIDILKKTIKKHI